MLKNNSITFRVTQTDKKRIEARAKKAKMKTSDFVRLAVLNKEIHHTEGLSDCNYELNKIGNNINQIAVLMHQRRIDNSDLSHIAFTLEKAIEVIYGRLGGFEGPPQNSQDFVGKRSNSETGEFYHKPVMKRTERSLLRRGDNQAD